MFTLVCVYACIRGVQDVHCLWHGCAFVFCLRFLLFDVVSLLCSGFCGWAVSEFLVCCLHWRGTYFPTFFRILLFEQVSALFISLVSLTFEVSFPPI